MRNRQECEFLPQEKCYHGENKSWPPEKLAMGVPCEDS